jgi:eukaryotic-like serine/threonine-protein kinase
VPGNTDSRAALVAEAQRYLSELAASPAADEGLRIETANGLIELARVQGSPLEPNLAFIPDAMKNLLLAEKLLASLGVAAAKQPDVGAALARAQSYRALMELHGNTDAAASKRLLALAGDSLENVPVGQRVDGWLDARRLYRRSLLEYADLEESVPDLISNSRKIEAEIGQWSAARQRSPDASFDRALSAYYTGIADFVSNKGDYGTAAFSRANARLEAVERIKPGDPSVLYMMAWSNLLGASAASSARQPAASTAFTAKANDIANRLLLLNDHDDATIVLARNAAEAYSQDLANRGHYAEAIAAQRDVIAREKARLIRDGGGLGINLAYSEMILGTIGRQAGNRALACENWGIGETRYASVEKKGKILAFQKVLLAGLRRNVADCKAGVDLTKMKPLK